ncbi:uncharacterized protein LOC131251822 isoform X1 [Magnolia sinica]|uniref:uncharacterized protein LOC131251822 isoform X1 n=1 Tax=Magnolia sinica TaxID=86752 RepID=UPI00265A55FA|nr:uncharacterized protein LOC131251822 isoform X1 [Magnolia sinica]XP_058108767.1 uncharacterized protein LOC131251822 isoform X1 [Magnolia sinica]
MEQGEDTRRSSSSRKEKKKKKRKRSDVEIETFSEDTAAETEIIPQIDGNIAPSVELSVKMESFRESSDKIAPVVGYFPSGFDPLKHRMSNEAGDDPKIRVFRNKQFSNRLQVVVSPKESKVEYVGTSFLGEATAPQVCTYALGVLDKETKRLKIVPITANKIFRLEPRVRGVPRVLNEEDLTEEKKVNNVADLTNVFGTKQSKRRFRKWEVLLRKEVDPEAQREIESKIEGVEINKEALERVSAEVGNIPPHDTTATTPEKAYPLDKIILKGEWDHLSDVMELMQSGANTASAVEFWRKDTYPSFVCNRIHKLGEIGDEDEKKKLACIFSYITLLIRFRNLSKNHKKSLPVVPNTSAYHKIPIALFDKFIRMFADTEADRLPKEKGDLLISYILVLTLYADGFLTDITDIAKDLKMAPSYLRPYYVHLGCKCPAGAHSLKKSVVVALRVPLQLPKLKMKFRR